MNFLQSRIEYDPTYFNSTCCEVVVDVDCKYFDINQLLIDYDVEEINIFYRQFKQCIL